MSFDTPILMIVFNRPEKTEKLFNIIKKIKPKILFVAADGPREKQSDIYNCKKVRKIFDNIDFKCEIYKRFNSKNEGLKKNVKSSIDWFFSKVKKGIIIEDDCIPSLSFFNFCQELLVKYEGNEKIMQINGTNLGIDYSDKVKETYFFSKLNHVWGWATWKRSWMLFDNEFKDYKTLKKNKSFNKYFIDNKITNWMMKYFDKSESGADNIWSINWAYSILKNNGLCITPTKNLVQNIGFDGSGTSVRNKSFISFSETEINHLDKIVHPLDVNHNLNNDILAYDSKISKIDPRANMLVKIKIKLKDLFQNK